MRMIMMVSSCVGRDSLPRATGVPARRPPSPPGSRGDSRRRGRAAPLQARHPLLHPTLHPGIHEPCAPPGPRRSPLGTRATPPTRGSRPTSSWSSTRAASTRRRRASRSRASTRWRSGAATRGPSRCGDRLASIELPDAGMSQGSRAGDAGVRRLGGGGRGVEERDAGGRAPGHARRARRRRRDRGGAHVLAVPAGAAVRSCGAGCSTPRRRPPRAPGLHTLSPAFERVLAALAAVAPAALPVILEGRDGHGQGGRGAGDPRACRRGAATSWPSTAGRLPAALVEGQLFGTSAARSRGRTEDRPGLFRAADGGTLLLDEIGELAPPAQAALLRALEQREVLPIGATRPVPVDVRVLAATHQPLDRPKMEEGARFAATCTRGSRGCGSCCRRCASGGRIWGTSRPTPLARARALSLPLSTRSEGGARRA